MKKDKLNICHSCCSVGREVVKGRKKTSVYCLKLCGHRSLLEMIRSPVIRVENEHCWIMYLLWDKYKAAREVRM